MEMVCSTKKNQEKQIFYAVLLVELFFGDF